MINTLARKIFGSANDREVKRLQPLVARTNEFEPTMAALSDEKLAAKTLEYRERLSRGEKLDNLLPEAFATCREMSKRVLKMRHFDVQLIGGMVLH